MLENALLGENESSDDSSVDTEEVKVQKQRRGRSRPPGALTGYAKSKKFSTLSNKQHISSEREVISPIISIPTNGEGCVILREDGSFDVIGEIPKLLEEKLFPKKGVSFPEQIFLGTQGRHFVRFDDGTYFFYGPSELAKVLNPRMKQRRGKNRNRGKRDKVIKKAPVVSVAFGEALDNFFVVRSDGTWDSHGDLPDSLEELMDTHENRMDLLWVAFGPDKAWCIKEKNGSVHWGEVPEEVDERLGEIISDDGDTDILYLAFGQEESFFLLHK